MASPGHNARSHSNTGPAGLICRSCSPTTTRTAHRCQRLRLCLVCPSNDSFTPSTPPSPACSAGVCIACCHESVAHSHHRCRAPLPLAEPNFPSLSPRFYTIHHHTSRSPLRHTPATRHLSCNTDSHALRHPLPPTHGVPFNLISNRTISHHGVASPAGRPRSGCRLR